MEIIVKVAIKDLVLSDMNVRNTYDEKSIEHLADSILSVGLLQNLVVVQTLKDGVAKYEVVAGGRRLKALQWLVEEGRLNAESTVPVQLIDNEKGLTVSMTENEARLDTSPYERLKGVLALNSQGYDADYICSHFGISHHYAKQLIALSNISPALVELLNDGESEMTVEHLKALSKAKSHADQETVWESYTNLNHYQKNSNKIRQMIDDLSKSVNFTQSKFAMFIGIDSFTKAGGVIEEDLFSGEITFNDIGFLEKLVYNELETIAKDLVDNEGWGEYDIHVYQCFDEKTRDLYYEYMYDYHLDLKQLSDEERERQNKILIRNDEIESEVRPQLFHNEPINDLMSFLPLIEELKENHIALCKFNLNRINISDEVKSKSKIQLLMSDKYELKIKAIVPKSIDGESSQTVDENGVVIESGQNEENAKLSNTLMERISNHRSMAIQVELIKNPKLALAVTVYQALSKFHQSYLNNVAGLDIKFETKNIAENLDDAEKNTAHELLAQYRTLLKEKYDTHNLTLEELANRPYDELMKLFSICTGLSFYLESYYTQFQNKEFGRIEKLLPEFKLIDYWQPTEDTYFKHLSKAQLINFIETHGDKSLITPSLKKSDLVLIADECKPEDWLPEFLIEPKEEGVDDSLEELEDLEEDSAMAW